MKTAFVSAVLLAAAFSALSAPPPATAQDRNPDTMHHAMPAAAQSDAVPKVNGEIRKVDTDTGKITIRHGEIPNLEMPAMTMVFRVASPDMLSMVKTGDQVLFTAEKSNGALTVTSIELLPQK